MSLDTPTTFDIGSLRQRIRIQRNEGPQSASGSQEVNWVNVARVYAAIDDETGNELFAAREIYPEKTTTITIRYLANIDRLMRLRVLWLDPRTRRDHQFDVKDVLDLETRRHHIMQLKCEERPIERPV